MNLFLHFVLKRLGNNEGSDLEDVLTATPPTDDLITSGDGMGTTDYPVTMDTTEQNENPTTAPLVFD